LSYFSQLEPFLFSLDLLDQRFHLATNMPGKLILLKHAYFALACLLK
jgi:hypothetical protein